MVIFFHKIATGGSDWLNDKGHIQILYVVQCTNEDLIKKKKERDLIYFFELANNENKELMSFNIGSSVSIDKTINMGPTTLINIF